MKCFIFLLNLHLSYYLLLKTIITLCLFNLKNLYFVAYMATSVVFFYTVALTPPILDIFYPLNQTRQKIYVVEVEYILFDKNEYYSFVYIQSMIVGIFAIFTITTCDIMLYSLIQHACGMYSVLW